MPPDADDHDRCARDANPLVHAPMVPLASRDPAFDRPFLPGSPVEPSDRLGDANDAPSPTAIFFPLLAVRLLAATDGGDV